MTRFDQTVPGSNLIQDQISDAPPQSWTQLNPKIHPYLIRYSFSARLYDENVDPIIQKSWDYWIKSRRINGVLVSIATMEVLGVSFGFKLCTALLNIAKRFITVHVIFSLY